MTDKGYDPGWNDPPKLSYNPDSASAKPKNLLNKRVPFSMNGSNSNRSTEAGAMSQPPICIPPQPFPPPFIIPSPKSPVFDIDKTVIVDDEKLAETVKILSDILESSIELASKIDGIKKRLNTMEGMWKEGKLCLDVQSRTFQLAKALEDSDSQLADKLHKSLMIDYPSIVSSWMVGIKQLVLHRMVVNELLQIDKEST